MQKPRLLEVADSEFGRRKNGIDITAHPFYAGVKLAVANPNKAVEISVPSEMCRGTVLSQIWKIGKQLGYKIHCRAGNVLFDRGVIQIKRGDPLEPGFEEPEVYDVAPEAAAVAKGQPSR